MPFLWLIVRIHGIWHMACSWRVCRWYMFTSNSKDNLCCVWNVTAMAVLNRIILRKLERGKKAMKAISKVGWVPIMYTALDIYTFREDSQAEKTAWANVGRQKSIHKVCQGTTSSGGSSTLIKMIEMSLKNFVGITSWVALRIRPRFGVCFPDDASNASYESP